MDSVLTRFISDLADRLHGPFAFRFVLQPLMALIYAVRDGLADARSGRPPYFWAMFRRAAERKQLLKEGWKAMTRVIVLGVTIDILYQLIVFRWIYPLQLAVIVLGLAFLPYVILRGPIGRLASSRSVRSAHPAPRPFDAGREDAGQRRDRASRRHRT